MNGIATSFRLALGPILPQIQNVQGSVSIGIKRLEHEVDHIFPPSAEVENA
jgi:hypothetical protein